jgi:Epoxide hydrolase N terminus
MAIRTDKSADAIAIRPFRVEIPEAEIEGLRARIATTRWPEKETVADTSQGVQLATMQALARYWSTEYDFGRLEAKLNAFPHFVTEIDTTSPRGRNRSSSRPRCARRSGHRVDSA